MANDGWLSGAVVGFATAFLIQAFAGHWKLWVDGRKSAIDDLVKAIEAAKVASATYFKQETIQAGQAHAADVIYTQKLATDLFGLIDKRFGPLPDNVTQTFRTFRELTTGDGFMKAGPGDEVRSANIAVAAASATNAIRDWALGQLSFFASTRTWIERLRRNNPTRRFTSEEIARLSR